MLVNINEINSVLMIFNRQIEANDDKIIEAIPKLHELCIVTGILTFSAALFGGLTLQFAYKLVIF
jgi:hypothetical protein